MAKIGFIGTGIMGHPMALNLQKAGHSLFLSAHHDAAPADLIAGGAVALANPKEVAQEAEADGHQSLRRQNQRKRCSVPRRASVRR